MNLCPSSLSRCRPLLGTFVEIKATGLAEVSLQPSVNAAFAAQNVGGMFGLYFAEQCPATYEAVLACDKEAFNRFFHAMLDAGHYFAPSAFEAGFVSAAHSEADIAATVAVANTYFASLK